MDTYKRLYQHFATGGTIDSEWVAEHDTAETRSVSTSAEYLTWLARRFGFGGIDSTILALKDSRAISVADRKEFAAKIIESPADRILVTSGTYLMPEVARHIADHVLADTFKTNNKRVVITGSLIPIKGFEMSDGGFNIGMAIALLGENELPIPSVIAAINGQAIPATYLEKDLTTATFAKDEEHNLLNYDNYLLIPAGGTIDFQPGNEDILVPADESLVADYIKNKVRTVMKPLVTQPLLKDSRDMTSEDIENIVKLVLGSHNQHIIITCGLLRIREIRDRLVKASEKHAELEDKIIVLTGSRLMLGMAGFSDATFNLGFAHGMLGVLKAGIYVALSGRIYRETENPLKDTYSSDQLDRILTNRNTS